MLATPGKLFSARGWVFELKYDGFRCLVTKCGDVVRLESRNGRDMSDLFPELVARKTLLCGRRGAVPTEAGRPRKPRVCRRSTQRVVGVRCL